MKSLSLIAYNTLLELIRDKILYGLLMLAILMIGLAYYVSNLSYGYHERIIIDIGLAIINIFGVITAVFISCTTLDKEKNKKTLLLLLSKPIARVDFLLGKYLGFCMMLGIELCILTIMLYFILWLLNTTLSSLLWVGIGMIYLEIILVTALGLLFSILLPSTISIFATTIIYWLGHYNDLFRQSSLLATEDIFGLSYILSLILPNFQLFNITSQISNHSIINKPLLYYSTIYGFLYISLLLFLANLIFKRKLIY